MDIIVINDSDLKYGNYYEIIYCIYVAKNLL